jgi:hypothetical protein
MSQNLRQSAQFLQGIKLPATVDFSFGEIRGEKEGVKQFNSNQALALLSDAPAMMRHLMDSGFPVNAPVFSGARFYENGRLSRELLDQHQFPIYDYGDLSEVYQHDQISQKRLFTTKLKGREVVEISYCPTAVGPIMGTQLNGRLATRGNIPTNLEGDLDSLLKGVFANIGLDCGTARFAVHPSQQAIFIVSVRPDLYRSEAQNMMRMALPYVLHNLYGIEI